MPILNTDLNSIKMKTYRKTWRHELYIKADTAKEAQEIWEDVDLGKLTDEETDGVIERHDFVEEVSFEDEDYRDVSNLEVAIEIDKNKKENEGSNRSSI